MVPLPRWTEDRAPYPSIAISSGQFLSHASLPGQKVQLLLAFAYFALTPLVILPLPSGGKFGAADLAFIPCAVFLLRYFSNPYYATTIFVVFVGYLIVHWILIQIVFPDLVRDVGEYYSAARLVSAATAFLAFSSFRLTERSWRIVSGFLLVGLSFGVSIGVVLHTLGVQIRDNQQSAYIGAGFGTQLRAGGLLGNSGDFGHLASMCAVIGLATCLLNGWRRLAWVMVALGTLGVFMSTSRAGILHISFGLGVMSPLLLRDMRRAAKWVLIGLPFLAVTLGLLTARLDARSTLLLRKLDFLDLSGTGEFYRTPRFENWADYLTEGFWRHPFVGSGYGQLLPQFARPGDNSFLTLLVELGLVGGLLWLIAWVALLIRALNAHSWVRWIAVAVVLSEIVHMLTIDTHRMWATEPIALAFIGLILGRSAPSRPKNEHIHTLQEQQ